MLYPIAIIQKDGYFHGRLPDLPEVTVKGKNMADTISHARHEVMIHLQTFVDDDLPMPEGSDVSSHLSNEDFAGWTWAIVNIESSRIIGESVNIDIEVPERLMKNIAQYIDKADISLNEFFIQATKAYLNSNNT